MGTLIRCVLIAVVFVGPAAMTQAGSCGFVNYSYTPTYTPVYERKIVEKVIVLDYLPPYPVGYAPTYAVPVPAVQPGPAKSACEEKLDALSAKLAAVEAKLSAPPLEAPPPRKAAAPVAKGDGLAVLQSKCASCHTGTAAKKGADGQPVVIFSEPGKLSADADPVGMLLQIEDEHMPPGKPLTAEEKRAVREFIRTATAKK